MQEYVLLMEIKALREKCDGCASMTRALAIGTAIGVGLEVALLAALLAYVVATSPSGGIRTQDRV